MWSMFDNSARETKRALQNDDPLMLAWKEFTKTETCTSSYRHAQTEHTMGAMWEAFVAGWRAAHHSMDRVEKVTF